MKNLVQPKIVYALQATACLLLLSACGDIKNVVEAPKVTLDPPYKPVEKKQGADVLEKEQWALKKIDAEKAWQLAGKGSRRIRVAILSSGVDYNHEDLQGNLFINQKENAAVSPLKPMTANKIDDDKNGYVDDLLGWDVVDGDGFPYDHLGDGTAAAGIIGARHNNGVGIKGILDEVTIVPVRYIDSSGASSVERLIEGLKYLRAIDPKPDVVLIQLANVDFAASKGFETDGFLPPGEATLSPKAALGAELERLKKDDIPVVVSSGNRSSDVATVKGVVTEFAKQENVFVVSSVDENDAKPSGANYSPRQVITSAPGVNVLTTVPGNKYEVRKGTFIAAAHVAGAIALALTKYHGQISTGDLRKAFLNEAGSDVVPGLSEFNLGSNRLNIGRFMEYLISTKR